MPSLNQIRKALVPLVVVAVAYVATKLGADLPADQVEVIAGAIVTAVLTYLVRNDA